MKTLGPFDLRLQNYSSCMLFGSSYSGKSTLSVRIALERDLIYREPHENVIYYYAHEQPLFEEAKNADDGIKFISDESELDDELSSSGSCLLFLDDFVWEALGKRNKFMCNLFTILGHHKKITSVYQSQIMFSPKARTLNLSTHYYCLFRSFHQAQMSYFFRDISPEKYKFLLESYHLSTDNKPYSHFFISHHPLDLDRLRYRDNIIPKDGVRIFTPRP